MLKLKIPAVVAFFFPSRFHCCFLLLLMDKCYKGFWLLWETCCSNNNLLVMVSLKFWMPLDKSKFEAGKRLKTLAKCNNFDKGKMQSELLLLVIAKTIQQLVIFFPFTLIHAQVTAFFLPQISLQLFRMVLCIGWMIVKTSQSAPARAAFCPAGGPVWHRCTVASLPANVLTCLFFSQKCALHYTAFCF